MIFLLKKKEYESSLDYKCNKVQNEMNEQSEKKLYGIIMT